MKLNSYNMAVKTLNASGCFADMVDRMWTYMEEGDTEKADCARHKALMLLGLIKTARRWKPSLGSGAKTVTITSEIDSGSYTIPYMYTKMYVNGIVIRERRKIVFTGGNSDVLGAIVQGVKCGLPLNDDLIRVKSFNTTGVFTYKPSVSPITSAKTEETSSVTFSVTQTDEETINDQPLCLTDTQILSVVKKIDELCDNCNC